MLWPGRRLGRGERRLHCIKCELDDLGFWRDLYNAKDSSNSSAPSSSTLTLDTPHLFPRIRLRTHLSTRIGIFHTSATTIAALQSRWANNFRPSSTLFTPSLLQPGCNLLGALLGLAWVGWHHDFEIHSTGTSRGGAGRCRRGKGARHLEGDVEGKRLAFQGTMGGTVGTRPQRRSSFWIISIESAPHPFSGHSFLHRAVSKGRRGQWQSGKAQPSWRR